MGLTCDTHVEDVYPGALDLKPTLHSGISNIFSSWILCQKTTRTNPKPILSQCGFLCILQGGAQSSHFTKGANVVAAKGLQRDAMFQLVRHNNYLENAWCPTMLSFADKGLLSQYRGSRQSLHTLRTTSHNFYGWCRSVKDKCRWRHVRASGTVSRLNFIIQPIAWYHSLRNRI